MCFEIKQWKHLRLKAKKNSNKKLKKYIYIKNVAKPFKMHRSAFLICALVSFNPLLPCPLCVLFVPQVPQVRARTVASVKVDLQGAKAITSKKTKILIKPPTFIHLVQTDKPIYKPGQTGRGGRECCCIVWWQRLCAGYSKCGGGCVSSLAPYTGSRLSLLTQPTLSARAPLTNSAAFAQISTTSKCLHNAEPRLENFRNHIFIQRAEEQGFLKSSW